VVIYGPVQSALAAPRLKLPRLSEDDSVAPLPTFERGFGLRNLCRQRTLALGPPRLLGNQVR
jgi:hypothetical protein